MQIQLTIEDMTATVDWCQVRGVSGTELLAANRDLYNTYCDTERSVERMISNAWGAEQTEAQAVTKSGKHIAVKFI